MRAWLVANCLGLGLALGLSLGLATAARATVLMPLDTAALTQRADRVVLGTVESSQAHWSADHKSIYTDVTLRVTQVYKGDASVGGTVVVRREGGSIDGVGMRVFGAASFSLGEEVVVFMETRGVASYTVGMTQGKLRVVRGSDGIKRVAADLSAVAFARPGGGTVQESSAQAPRRLEDLEREIRSYAGTSGK
jgi:hypothetical protein